MTALNVEENIGVKYAIPKIPKNDILINLLFVQSLPNHLLHKTYCEIFQTIIYCV